MKRLYQFYIFIMLVIASSFSDSFAKPNENFPASTQELTFNANGKRMSGFIYQAQGPALKPTVLLLHGYPGNEKNLDVAQALRSIGWNVVFFHYRGSWGSEGEFGFLNAEQDVQTVLTHITNQENAKKLRINRHLISLVGHSMGGHMAIAGILDNPLVNCAVAYDGANLGVNDVGLFSEVITDIPWKAYSDSLFMLNGWSGEKAIMELNNHSESLNLVRRVNTLNGRPVLLVAADTPVIPINVHIKPLLGALKSTKNSRVFYQLIEDDHSFSHSRAELIDITARFLNANCLIN